MNRVNMTQVITSDYKEDHITTMQDFSSSVSFSPSFSFYVTGDVQLVQAAVKAVRETESYYSVKIDDADFEFETLPLREDSFFQFPTMTTTLTSKLSSDDNDEATDRVTSKDLLYGGWNFDDQNPLPSLPSPSDSDDSSNLSPTKKYCFWSRIRSLARGDNSKSKRSSSAPKRCRLKEVLRRSHSDRAVASKKCVLKNLLRRSHSDGGGSDVGCSNSPSVTRSPAVKGRSKSGSYSPEMEVIKRRKSYLPYKQDLIGVFIGMSRFSH